MSDPHGDRAWFAPKEFGYGATPSSWQGWLATVLFVLLIAMTAAFLDPRPDDLPHRLGLYRLPLFQALHPRAPYVLALVAIECAAFVALTWWKSSAPWTWRWGRGR